MNTIPAPALSGIVGLLLLPRLDADGEVRASAIDDLDALAAKWSLASARDIAARHIERWMRDGCLPSWAAIALLMLFEVIDFAGLSSTDDAQDRAASAGEAGLSEARRRHDSDETSHTVAGLFAEDIHAFCARARLAGGAAGACLPGAVWDEFAERHRRNEGSDGEAVSIFPLVEDGGGEWRTCLDPDATHEVAAHSRVAFRIKPPAALLGSGLPVHLYLFHDVRTEFSRVFVPLLPLPGAAGFKPATIPTRERVLVHPVAPDHANCFVVPDNWGPVRHVVGVASTRPFGNSLLHEATQRWTISPCRLDLLASRLQDHDRWRPGSYEVMHGSYAVRGDVGSR